MATITVGWDTIEGIIDAVTADAEAAVQAEDLPIILRVDGSLGIHAAAALASVLMAVREGTVYVSDGTRAIQVHIEHGSIARISPGMQTGMTLS